MNVVEDNGNADSAHDVGVDVKNGVSSPGILTPPSSPPAQSAAKKEDVVVPTPPRRTTG